MAQASPYAALAAKRGHTERAEFDGGLFTLDLFYAPDADTEGTFVATCADTGEELSVNGWLFSLLSDED